MDDNSHSIWRGSNRSSMSLILCSSCGHSWAAAPDEFVRASLRSCKPCTRAVSTFRHTIQIGEASSHAHQAHHFLKRPDSTLLPHRHPSGKGNSIGHTNIASPCTVSLHAHTSSRLPEPQSLVASTHRKCFTRINPKHQSVAQHRVVGGQHLSTWRHQQVAKSCRRTMQERAPAEGGCRASSARDPRGPPSLCAER